MNRDRNRRRGLVVTACMVGLLVAAGCGGDESRAERLYREAMTAVDEDRLSDAVRILDRIVREYPDTQVADRAREDATLYRGLAGAVSRYPVKEARQLMVRTARVLERYRSRRGKLPKRLSDLVPDWLPETPIDPWGNPLSYETTRRGRGYELTCLGADGLPGGTGEDADLRISNGEFVRADLEGVEAA